MARAGLKIKDDGGAFEHECALCRMLSATRLALTKGTKDSRLAKLLLRFIESLDRASPAITSAIRSLVSPELISSVDLTYLFS